MDDSQYPTALFPGWHWNGGGAGSIRNGALSVAGIVASMDIDESALHDKKVCQKGQTSSWYDREFCPQELLTNNIKMKKYRLWFERLT